MLKATNTLSSLFGISKATEKLFAKLDITNIHGLVEHFPRGYENRGDVVPVKDLVFGEVQSCIVTVGSAIKSSRIPSRNGGKAMTVQKFTAYDDTGSVACTFFNREYMSYSIPVGTKVRLYGKVGGGFTVPEFNSPSFEPIYEKTVLLEYVPKYPLTAGLTDNIIIKAVKQCLDVFKAPEFDILTEEQRNRYGLCSYYEALCKIHFPKSEQDIRIAKKRLAFDELLNFKMSLLRLSRDNKKSASFRMEDINCVPFIKSLPFTLTDGQLGAIRDIMRDMSKDSPPMRRLIQGDVGCGKTLIAAAAVYICVKNGRQAAMMAPTAILATQHYESLAPLMEQHGIRCELLTGSTSSSKKKSILKRLAAHEIDFLIGTHALIESNVEFSSLSLVITDEQHRFGVRQRESLENKASLDDDFGSEIKPHMLVMSATPIPRTLAMMLYGDLDITIVSDLPPGRQKVDTFAVGEEYRERLNKFIEKHVENGNQVYVVCPLVKDAEEQDDDIGDRKALKSVERFCEELRARFPLYTVELMHGKLKNANKDKIMSKYASGQTNILVSTTVIEVGVNVPNSTLMIIENAERFGLSQLHQLRGRVGRGDSKSYCILVSPALNGNRKNTSDNPTVRRLNILCSSNNGFEIAEQDLLLRGPGEFFGERQHGEMRFKIADIASDMHLVEMASELAEKLIYS